jgi:hypothetical protein
VSSRKVLKVTLKSVFSIINKIKRKINIDVANSLLKEIQYGRICRIIVLSYICD